MVHSQKYSLIATLLAGAALFYAAIATAQTFVAPPRSISDITTILYQERPDADRVAKLIGEAEATITGSGQPLAEQLYRRGQAKAALGRIREAIADVEAAITAAEGADYLTVISRYEQLLIRLVRAGDPKRAIELIDRQLKAFQIRNKGRLFGLNQQMVIALINQGEINRAEGFAQRNRILLAQSREWPNVDMYRSNWTSSVEDSNARIYEARGRYAEAEQSYHRATELLRDALKQSSQWPARPPPQFFESGIDWGIANEGRVKARLGRVSEGEADVRRALLGRLSKVGKYHADTAGILGVLSWVLGEQGRYGEAEQVARIVVNIYTDLGYSEDNRLVVGARLQLANTLNMQRRYEDALEIYRSVDRSVANWDPARREAVINSSMRVNAMLASGDVSESVEMAKKYYEMQKRRTGEKNIITAVARGFVATSLARANRPSEAIAEFRATIPALIDAQREGDDEDGANAVAREGRVRFIIENYLGFLARNPNLADGDIGEETFRLADVIRGHAVERALAASNARAAASDPALSELVRKEQDLGKQVAAAVGVLNNLLAMAPEERDEAAVKDVQAQLARLKADRGAANKNIARRFPDYANLLEPAMVAPPEIRTLLRSDEAFLSFYFGRQNSFVWVVPKQGRIRFARIPANSREVEKKILKLRDALEPQATTISEIPPFDTLLAHELFQLLLDPVEDGWKPAKSLIVVTNGALGLLPLAVLPTAPSQIDRDDEPVFDSYRKVSWLARTHAVTMVPSAAALRTLRQLQPVTTAREQIIGFGDPLFSKEQAAEAAGELGPEVAQVAELGTRGLLLKRRSTPQLEGANTANLAMLPRLPDTADELRSIALALQADPSKVLNLGEKANERIVKSTNLSKYKILVFATHGLIPGEIDGLTQPALALSAPEVAGVEGDGLLTMEEILALKLNADWVVLSACNTGAGAGAGAEAASGLGRAFFYAGTRALLVTNWSVHSQSARELTTDLFRRQAENAKLTRSEALRQAMMALVDGPGYQNEQGKTLFTYGHPLFWAPYTIIGDGG